jgi:hypothetical protein
MQIPTMITDMKDKHQRSLYSAPCDKHQRSLSSAQDHKHQRYLSDLLENFTCMTIQSHVTFVYEH